MHLHKEKKKRKLTCHNCHGILLQMDCGRFLAAWSAINNNKKLHTLKLSHKSIDFFRNPFFFPPYISILIRGDRDKLRLRESESLHPSGLARVLGSVLVHLHHMQSRLVFMQRLQDHHLQEFKRKNDSQRASPHASLRTHSSNIELI